MTTSRNIHHLDTEEEPTLTNNQPYASIHSGATAKVIPRVLAIGGGTGLPQVLRGLCDYFYGDTHLADYLNKTDLITVLVTTTDDGGSSGRLRRTFNLLPPGDIRNCMAALAKDEVMMRLLQYRFQGKDGVSGHTLGNLVLAGLADIHKDFLKAIEQLGQLMKVRGKILPTTLSPVSLIAELTNGRKAHGETKISNSKSRIRRILLNPGAPYPTPGVISAIRNADLIIFGPGSLYTSIIPNLLVKGVARTIKESKAVKVLVCNIMTQPGETDDHTVADHISAIHAHVRFKMIDYVVINTGKIDDMRTRLYAATNSRPVSWSVEEIACLGVAPVLDDVLEEGPWIRHDPEKLTSRVIEIFKKEAKAGKREG
ncbi:MAG: YvcK family protein [Acidobacteria bacterium]|nr:YvcK family protein [Acidobacteriota bacterium]MBI3654993.1 YvcK family protein [Acidobacteriota bacterium]